MTQPLDEASRDLSADLAALRDDITKLTTSVSDMLRTQASATTNTVLGAVDNARQKFSDTASDAQDKVGAVSADLESAIERNPLVAMLIALGAGLLMGLLSRSRR